jgi:LAS superfamily LD-carboxypeptidase LdcB
MKEFAKKIPWGWIGQVVLLGLIGFGAYRYLGTVTQLNQVSDTLAKTTLELGATKADLGLKVDNLEKAVIALQQQNGAISDTIIQDQQRTSTAALQIGQITNTVGVLQKLSQTDPELLKKYSKVYFLNEHYVPLSLSIIDPKYIPTKGKLLEIHSSVLPHLNAMIAAAALNNVTIQIDSAYRSFATQAVLKSSYRFTYGVGTANQFSAEQGYSEHQLGTALDFTSPAIGGGLAGFDKTLEYAWLQANAYQYGFVLSYPPQNTYYQFEPWHWRFVGVALATKLHQDNTFFYDTDQRVIDTYLANLFD